MSFLPRFVTHNASLKIASLVAAAFLWAIAPADRTQQESLTSVPVRVQVADLAWTTAEPPFPSTVEIRVAGPAREIIRLARERATVRVPIESVASEDTVVTLRRDWVTLGATSGLVVEEILPASVQVRFEPVDSAVFVVDLAVEGELPDDVALVAPIQFTPQVVRARGPARLLESLDTIRTLSFDLGSIGASRVRAIAIDTTGLGSTLLDPREVQVAVRVDEAVTRNLSAVPVRLVGPGAAQYRVEPDSLPIDLVGAELRFQSADLSTVAYELDMQDIGLLEVGERRRMLPTAAGLPELIRVTTMSDSVTVVRPEGVDGGGG